MQSFNDGPTNPSQEPIAPTYRWATITSLGPLRIRFDGDAAPLDSLPDCLVKPTELAVGVRVWVQLIGLRLIVLGRGYNVS